MKAALENMTALNPMQAGPFKAMVDAGTEAMQFLSSRLQQDIEAQRAVMTCKTFEDLQKVQGDFYTKALEDYRGATAKLMGIMTAGAADSAKAATTSTKHRYDDVPL